MRTYKPTLALRLLIILFLFLPAAIFVVVALTGTTPALFLILAASFGLPGAPLYWLAGRAELTVDEKGVRRRGYLGGIIEMRFDEVVAYYSSSTTVNGAETVRFSLAANDGRKVTVTSNWRDIWDAVHQL